MSNSSYKCHEIQKEIAVAKENFTCLGLNYPSWLDDYSRFKPDAAPLSHDEHMEGLKCLTAMVRRNIALKYIISCHDRFGFKDIFVYENTVTEVNKELIENVLVCQIEKSILHEFRNLQKRSINLKTRKNQGVHILSGYPCIKDIYNTSFAQAYKILEMA
ncbi:hypothetical protein [Arsenophonus sp. PmNCSU2021_1]|uniref:hypothetical protein n=1 Tax=Arsenophonus sp. PmNCSU2021_1 TaxID=3118989 RepID=UPI002FF11CD5